MPSSRFLRTLLGVLAAARWLAPPSRRRDWYRQWRADVWHEWQWLSRRPAAPARRAALVARLAGAIRHAFWLRLYVRRLEMISHDLRYGWRLMVRRPAFTLVAVLMLGLGIGTSVTIFSWLQTALQPIPGVPDRDRLAMLYNTTRTRDDLSTSYPNLTDYRRLLPDSIDALVGQTVVPLNFTTGSVTRRVYGMIVTGDYFDALDVRPSPGRGFLPEEDRAPGQAPVVVLGHAFWLRQFAGDRSVVGTAVTINGRPFTVVGIAPPGFRGTVPHIAVEAWVPMMMQTAVIAGDRLPARGMGWLQPLAKLAPGVSLERAELDMRNLMRRVRAASGDSNQDGSLRLSAPWRSSSVTTAVAAVAGAQLAVALIVLLICCANVASLLLARAAARQKETAVRLALGAGRLRLVQQVMVESTLLAVAGGIVGVAFAFWAAGFVQWFVPPTPLPVDLAASLDWTALGFALGLTAASVVVFGLVPALQGSSASLAGTLKESAATLTASRSRAWLRGAIVVGQVALSVVLVVCAVLFLRTLRNAYTVDPGFSMRDGLLATIDLLPAGYDEARGTVLLDGLLTRLREVPGIVAVTTVRRPPLDLSGTSDTSFAVDGYTPSPREEMSANWSQVGADYLRTMGIEVIAGRDVSGEDVRGRPDVAIVNQTLARRYFGGGSPIGGTIRVGGRAVQVVGIARDGKYSSITESPRPAIYVPVQQWYRPDATLVVRTSGDPLSVLPAAQAIMRELDANVPLFEVRTMTEHLAMATFVQRMAASLVTGLGVIALLLAAVGLYGVIAGSVVQRLPEIGMRVALGATGADIALLILRQSARITAIGVALGLGLALVATRLVSGLLVGVAANDGVSYLVTVMVLAVVALAATVFPARRAASVDVIAALRHG